MNEPASNSTETNITTLLGFVEMYAVFRAETKKAAETVTIRALSIRELPKFIELAADEPGMIELCCKKDKGWADHLTDESHLALLQKAQELNFSRAVAWGERQLAAGQNLAPLVQKMNRHINSLSPVSRSA